jgi:hypothetical protein
MEDVTGIGDEKVLRQYNQWREVCRWDEPETPAFKVADKPLEVDWQATAGYWEQRYEETRRDLEALAARFNSRPLEERITVTEDQVSVRPYVRAKPRRSKLAAIEPDHPTVQAAPGEGQTGASGEATGHSPEGADPQIRDAYCRGRSGIPLGNWCNESQSGDATGADKEQPCPGCGSYRGTHGLGCRILALTQSGEERSE